MGKWEQQNAHFRIAELSQRMRLQVVEGDPTFNFMTPISTHVAKRYENKGGVLGAISGDGVKETRAVLRGAPNGHPTELVYYRRSDVDVGVTTTKLSESYEFRFTMKVARPFAPFEITLRAPGYSLESPPVMQLPPAYFGDPMLDAKFALSAADPTVARAIVQALPPLASMQFFHIRASEQSISFFATEFGAMHMLNAIEQLQYAMEQMASALEGRAIPGMMAS
ncbi:MAG: hypothetical protein FWD73_07485 [Polyangiaceae bacterium]|nr:hypothetical protein [Polyangiaceae bacterium]